MSILLLDNFDSFTHNLFHLLEKSTDEEIVVKRNHEIALSEILTYNAIVLSPGPGLPSLAGLMPQVLKEFATNKKILGVCLGMQAIGERFGAALKNLEQVVHGEARLLHVIRQEGIFQNCPTNFLVGRYHSWVIDRETIPDQLMITAVDEQNNIMAIQHKQLPVFGVQFHPESILSEYGDFIIQKWLEL